MKLLEENNIEFETLTEEERRQKDTVHKCGRCGKLWDCGDSGDNSSRMCKVDYMCDCTDCG